MEILTRHPKSRGQKFLFILFSFPDRYQKKRMERPLFNVCKTYSFILIVSVTGASVPEPSLIEVGEVANKSWFAVLGHFVEASRSQLSTSHNKIPSDLHATGFPVDKYNQIEILLPPFLNLIIDQSTNFGKYEMSKLHKKIYRLPYTNHSPTLTRNLYINSFPFGKRFI